MQSTITTESFDPFRMHAGQHLYAFDHVVQNPNFMKWPASVDKHHNWDGGLAHHTWEVIKIGLQISQEVKLDKEILVIAGLWHDYGKLWAYKIESTTIGGHNYGSSWIETSNKHLTGGHLARSYAEWIHYCSGLQMDEEFADAVGHCILSHHGSREWGSTARPQTNEAFVLHMADQISARLLGGEELAKQHDVRF